MGTISALPCRDGCDRRKVIHDPAAGKPRVDFCLTGAWNVAVPSFAPKYGRHDDEALPTLDPGGNERANRALDKFDILNILKI
jgi:hypothetical protein